MPYKDPEVRRARCRQYHWVNREKILAQKKERYVVNREEILARSKMYCEANREKISAQKRGYYWANREKILVQRRVYYEANREDLLEQDSQYYEVNRDVINQQLRMERMDFPEYVRERERKAVIRRLQRKIDEGKKWMEAHPEAVAKGNALATGLVR